MVRGVLAGGGCGAGDQDQQSCGCKRSTFIAPDTSSDAPPPPSSDALSVRPSTHPVHYQVLLPSSAYLFGFELQVEDLAPPPITIKTGAAKKRAAKTGVLKVKSIGTRGV
jgi:hypothetical protein